MVSDNLTLGDWIEVAGRVDAGCGISWNDVEDYGERVDRLDEGTAFMVVLSAQDCQRFQTFTGTVVRKGLGSVSVKIERGWQNDVITWAPDTKVIPLPPVTE